MKNISYKQIFTIELIMDLRKKIIAKNMNESILNAWLKLALDEIENAQGIYKSQKQMKWISVLEQEPDIRGEYLVVITIPNDKWISHRYYTCNYGWSSNVGAVTHWMPMLELPNE